MFIKQVQEFFEVFEYQLMLMGPDQKQEIASYILPEVMVTDLGIVGRGEGNKRYQSTKLAPCARFM